MMTASSTAGAVRRQHDQAGRPAPGGSAPDTDYAKMARLYDLVMVKGQYYDYDKIAENIAALDRDQFQLDEEERLRLLELGIGTGLVPERLLRMPRRPLYERVSGVDLTLAMLDIARERLAPWGFVKPLEMQDVTALNLPGLRYHVIFSYGGPWYWVKDGNSWLLVSHIPGDAANARGLARAAKHLTDDGRLLLGIQAPHRDYAKAIDGTGLTYQQEIDWFDGGFRKRYRAIPDDAPGAEPRFDMTLDYRLFSHDEAIGMLAQCGLSPAPAHGPMFLEFAPSRA
jgi:hypothetical protein